MKEAQLKKLAKKSVNNWASVENQKEKNGNVWCYYCVKTYPATEISKYNDMIINKRESTALCPYCGYDGVITESVTKDIVEELHNKYFGDVE